jgi:hypothetical protein
MTRIDFCNRRASPLTSQVIDITAVFQRPRMPWLGMNCRWWRFLPSLELCAGQEKTGAVASAGFYIFGNVPGSVSRPAGPA